jgi:hypothetical protein
MLAAVCDADCSMLLKSSGIRKTRKSRHMGRLSSKILTAPRCTRGCACAIARVFFPCHPEPVVVTVPCSCFDRLSMTQGAKPKACGSISS